MSHDDLQRNLDTYNDRWADQEENMDITLDEGTVQDAKDFLHNYQWELEQAHRRADASGKAWIADQLEAVGTTIETLTTALEEG